MLFRCLAIFAFILLPTFLAYAQNQSKAVISTNYQISLDHSEADSLNNLESNGTSMNIVMPAGRLSGYSLRYDYQKSTSKIPTVSKLDAKNSGYGASYFIRDYALGRIGYEMQRIDQKTKLISLSPDEDTISTKTDVEIEKVYSEIYMTNSTLFYSKTENSYKSIGKTKDKSTGVSWYFGPNFLMSYTTSKIKSNIDSDKTKTESVDFTYQPKFTKNIASINLKYHRNKEDHDLDMVSLIFKFYFQSPVSLKNRDRKFQ